MARRTPAELEAAIDQWYENRGMKRQKAEKRALKIVLREQIRDKLESLTASDAAAVVYLFDRWTVGTDYAVGDVVRWGKIPYRVLQAHKSKANWKPHKVPALFRPLRVIAGANPDPWVQPTGANDAYSIGDRVTHDNPNDNSNIWIYESAIDANTTEPGRDGTFDRWWTPISAV